MVASPVVRAAIGTDDADRCAAILTDAFADDPVTIWLIPEPDDRAEAFYGYFHLFVRHGQDVGTVHLAGDHGCAVWLPSDAPDATVLDDELQRLCGRHAPRFTQFGQIVHDRHPAGPKHDYLMLLGTTTTSQGRGLGSALLSHRQHQLDPTGMPTYLEATTQRSAKGLYARAGYRPHGHPIQFPDGLQTYPLWRDPQPPEK
ncbi:GNAT family N-acetyltransferase [Actinomadura rubrisoli]|uniref:GNAT family N-acetyltransferase n=1 Tax=Actinomadura rubrisoli TaxID=2530368 RepID=A0A4R5AHS5_9ACTN|nr:GNAT family N-acetyltransferase [Actinomadura rubrisoli]TDD72193.1 GNAT family N-acetyltransferase [Actinomadura rubrisoli]